MQLLVSYLCSLHSFHSIMNRTIVVNDHNVFFMDVYIWQLNVKMWYIRIMLKTLQISRSLKDGIFETNPHVFFNQDQRNVYSEIIACMSPHYVGPRCFLLDAVGGTGKTFVLNAIYMLLAELHEFFSRMYGI